MFDSVRSNQRIFLFLILLLILPGFVFFGVQGLESLSFGVGGAATVGSHRISENELENAHRRQIDQMRAQLGEQFDPSMFDTAQARAQTLDSLVTRYALLDEANRAHLSAGDDRVRQMIASIPAFQGEDGKFDPARYRQMLSTQGEDPIQFESALRQDLSLQWMVDAVRETGFVPKAVVDRVIALQTERRSYRLAHFDPKDYEEQVKPTDEQLKAWYDGNQRQLMTPETADIEYVVLDRADMEARLSPSEADLKQYYEAHKDQYPAQEQRRARHILVKVDADADQKTKDEAKARAAQLLARAKAAPDSFVELAKASDDTGSAGNGGDLGYFTADMMVKPFSDAAFALKKDEFAPLVESEFGFHVMQVTDVKPAGVQDFAEVRNLVESQLRRERVDEPYQKAQTRFANLASDAPDSVEPIAKELGLELKKAAAVPRVPTQQAAEGADAVLSSQKFLQALFSDEALKEKRNAQPVEVSPGKLVTAHVIAHHPSVARPFDEVRERVVGAVKLEEARRLAAEAGKAALEAARKDGTLPERMQKELVASRVEPGALRPQEGNALFRMPRDPLPSFEGVELAQGGYALIELLKVQASDPKAAEGNPQLQALEGRMNQMSGQASMEAYLASLRQRTKIDISKAALERGAARDANP